MSSPQVAEFAREQMVSQQIRAWDVLDETILDLFRRLPREAFVPARYRDTAYADLPVPLPCGQHMLRPSVVGRLLQSVAVRQGERVLEVGTGSGYVSACLGALGAQVRSLEIHGELAATARASIAAVGLGQVEVVEADAFASFAAGPQYDVVVLTGSLPVHDPRFESLLRPGGRLFAIVGNAPAMEARLVTAGTSGERRSESLFETVVAPLEGTLRTDTFRF
jgi:protein-L-isoaspartate(D-aspartate) O-methyltransferase